MRQGLKYVPIVIVLLSLALAARAELPSKVQPAIVSGQPPVLQMNGVLLSVPLFPQETNSWCWAASGQMAMQYFGYSKPQCEQASYQFGQPTNTNCCNTPTPGLCISGGTVEIGHYGFTYQQLGGSSALSAAQIKDQISTRHTPWILNPNSPGFGHVTVGVGYITLNSAIWLVGINDPWPPNTGDFYYETYASYQCGYWGGVCHTEGYDLYNIKPPKLQLPKIPVPFTVQIPPLHLPPGEVKVVLNGDTDPVKAAAAAWQLLQHLITKETAAKLGIESAAAAEKMRLGKPVEQLAISLARLRSWNGKGSANELLEKSPALLVPVEADAHAPASLRLLQTKTVWRLATFGSPNFSQAWSRARKTGGQFLVEIESLELSFAGRRDDGKVFLTPLFSDPRLNLEAGREQPAEKILAQLTEAAKAYKPSVLTARKR